jgi:hypothetical protein
LDDLVKGLYFLQIGKRKCHDHVSKSSCNDVFTGLASKAHEAANDIILLI